MLTRHLYRLDEVRSSLVYSIKCRRLIESCFWLQELEESLYGNEARRVLFFAWFLLVGLKRIKWLEEWSDYGSTREGRLKLTWQLARCSERDSSLWWLIFSALLIKPGPSTGTLVQGWRSMIGLEDEVFWEIVVNGSMNDGIDKCLEQLQTEMRSYSVLARLTAFALVHTQGHKIKGTWSPLSDKEPIDLRNDIESWKKASLREQRVYKIPEESLFGMTLRGRGEDTKLELMELGEAQFMKSAWWKSKWLESHLDPSDQDEATEAFWNLYFPYLTCDIPDEWSLIDREKSHGEPVGTHGNLPLWRWWKVWVSSDRLYVWGKDAEIIKNWVDGQRADVGASILDRVLEMYKGEFEPYVVQKWKKVFVLV